MNVTCFLIEATGQYRRSLRRFSFNEREGQQHAHDASNFLDVVDKMGEEEDGQVSGDVYPHDDPKWPTRCSCGYVFKDADYWQLSHEPEYRRTDTGELTTLREVPAGAMWIASWYVRDDGADGISSPIHKAERPGQPHLIVKTPGGDWNVDQKSANGQGWSWTGTPPKVTARPSIGIYGPDGQTFKYHAFLTDGVLVDC
jgi:hypothetical protein